MGVDLEIVKKSGRLVHLRGRAARPGPGERAAVPGRARRDRRSRSSAGSARPSGYRVREDDADRSIDRAGRAVEEPAGRRRSRRKGPAARTGRSAMAARPSDGRERPGPTDPRHRQEPRAGAPGRAVAEPEELERRLCAAGFEPERRCKTTLDRPRGGGLVEDGRFAREVVRHQVGRRLAGHRAVAAALRAKGVDPDSPSGPLDEVAGRRGGPRRPSSPGPSGPRLSASLPERRTGAGAPRAPAGTRPRWPDARRAAPRACEPADPPSGWLPGPLVLPAARPYIVHLRGSIGIICSTTCLTNVTRPRAHTTQIDYGDADGPEARHDRLRTRFHRRTAEQRPDGPLLGRFHVMRTGRSGR